MPLNRLKRLIVPQEDVFFKLMESQAETANNAAQALYELMQNYHDVDKKCAKIKDFEHQGDQLMREIYKALNTTFIVPIDHSDISTLANSLDDVLDLTDQMATLLIAYGIVGPSQPMAQLAEILVKQTGELKHAVAAITHSKTYGNVTKHCTEIKRLENKADEVYIHAITALFKKNEAIEIIKQKEILDCLESATDRADKAAQHISDVVMKHS
jgi:hypothetical protein